MSNLIQLSVTNGIPTTTSLEVAERFSKQHKNVLQSIESLECSEEFCRLNFQPTSRKVPGPNGGYRLEPMYAVTKDGFMFLAMGFTGKEAAAWKERFIAAFNAMAMQLQKQATSRNAFKDYEQQFYIEHPKPLLSRHQNSEVNRAVYHLSQQLMPGIRSYLMRKIACFVNEVPYSESGHHFNRAVNDAINDCFVEEMVYDLREQYH